MVIILFRYDTTSTAVYASYQSSESRAFRTAVFCWLCVLQGGVQDTAGILAELPLPRQCTYHACCEAAPYMHVTISGIHFFSRHMHLVSGGWWVLQDTERTPQEGKIEQLMRALLDAESSRPELQQMHGLSQRMIPSRHHCFALGAPSSLPSTRTAVPCVVLLLCILELHVDSHITTCWTAVLYVLL